MFNIIKTYQDLPFFLLAILCCYCLLPNGVQSITIIVFSLLAIIINYKTVANEITKRRGITIWLTIVFWVLILTLTLTYSLELKPGFVVLQKLVSIFVLSFVILYAMPNLTKGKIETLLLVFVVSNIIFLGYLYFYFFSNIIKSGVIINNYSELIWFGIKKGYETPLLVHKTYFSMQMVFSISFLAWYSRKKELSNIKKLTMLLGIVLMAITMIFFLSGINVFLLLIVPLFFLKKDKKFNTKIFLTYIIFFLVLVVFTTKVYYASRNEDPLLRNRLERKLNFIDNLFVVKDFEQKKNLDKRILIYNCAISLIENKFLFGYGIGSQHVYLKGCYASKKDFKLYEQNFNSHNYFFFILLSGGIFALAPFLFMFYKLFIISFKRKDKLLLIFLLIIFLNLLLENTFSRINGVLFFTILLPILLRFNENLLDR